MTLIEPENPKLLIRATLVFDLFELLSQLLVALRQAEHTDIVLLNSISPPVLLIDRHGDQMSSTIRLLTPVAASPHFLLTTLYPGTLLFTVHVFTPHCFHQNCAVPPRLSAAGARRAPFI